MPARAAASALLSLVNFSPYMAGCLPVHTNGLIISPVYPATSVATVPAPTRRGTARLASSLGMSFAAFHADPATESPLSLL